ncbi:MAG: hypothetical protein ABSC06_01475 [Rhodopila sp.]
MTLVHFIPTGPATAFSWPDLQVDSAGVSIGRAPACGLRLVHPQIRFYHALLGADESGLWLRATDGAYLGNTSQRAATGRLDRLGDSVQIGVFVLTVRDIASNGDVTLSVTQESYAATDEAALTRRYFRLFNEALPNIRLGAFLLSILVFAVFFVFPLLSMPDRTNPARQAAAWQQGGAPAASAYWRVAELWNVGTISRAHGGFAANCSYCHQAPFVPVQSSACLTCHRGIGQHADPHLAPGADLSRQRCETCHLEHKGDRIATLDRQSDCVACHGKIRTIEPLTALPDVLDFGFDHPQFSPGLVQDAGLRKTKRFVIGDPRAEDNSNVQFTHATHLKLPKLSKAGEGNECAACHVAAPGGIGFKPVQFDSACASCHTLQFEPLHPEWRLPHGHAEEVTSRIAGYYAQALFAGESFTKPSIELFSRPGAPPQVKPPTGTDLINYKTREAIVSSIARSTCGECHVTIPPAEGQPASAWRIAPVFVPDRYMPASLFSHAAHATTRCQTCHAADTSNGGAISLLPGIATCRNCHTGEAGDQTRIASSCAYCHRFHDDRLPLASADQITAASRDPIQSDVPPGKSP